MSGPFETEREARAASLYATHGRDAGMPIRAANLADLAAELSGVELGAYDHQIIVWLAGWEPSTVAVVCGLISRARALGEQRQAADGRRPVPDSPSDAAPVAASQGGTLTHPHTAREPLSDLGSTS